MSRDVHEPAYLADIPTIPWEAEQADRSHVASMNDILLLQKLRAGDEAAFAFLLDQYCSSMSRLAMLYVSDRAVAEEVVQEAWMGILQGLDRFGGRCSLKTWIFRIVMNIAKTRCLREKRSIAFSSLYAGEAQSVESAADFDGNWISLPRNRCENPEEHLLAQETRVYIQMAIGALPLRQRIVITLHDVEGWRSHEVADLLGITKANQRVLLHRARSRVRRVLEQYFNEEGKG
jgi:RNA polymerase sigma-70 factor (ECF subfamily)